MVAQQLQERCGGTSQEDPVETTKSLICALNYISRDLPLPPHLFTAVSSIYHGASSSSLSDSDVSPPLPTSPPANKAPYGADLMGEFEDALLKQRPDCESGSRLIQLLDNRNKSHIQRRLSELEELPSTRGEDLQAKCLLELYGLKLRELQGKVRTAVSSEFWLRLNCADVSSQVFDWGMMRLPRPFYGVGDPFAMEADDQFRKKRDAERLSRLEEEEKNLIETAKRKFFAEVLNAVREFQLQIQATQKRRRQRNDGVQAWHGRQRQRATRAEKLRLMALKSDDQEAYMKLVKESKNERLTTLLEETNKLLANLGAAVQRQKDAKLPEGIDLLKDSESDLSELDAPRSEPLQDLLPDQDIDITESDNNDDSNDLLEGQRQYNSAIHSIQEKVTEQPSLLEGGELRSYQLEGLQWMVSLFNNNLNGILADEMGLGKTIQTISLIAYLLENKGVPGPYLIVAPKAVLPNWVNEFATWVPSIAAFLYDGRLEERKAIREKIAGEGKFNVLITHYDLIMRDKAFLKKIEWYYMIVDEGHRLKNHESALAKTLLTGYRIKRRLLLTGTPIQNSLQELWSLLNFLLPHIFNSVQNFEEWFNAPFADRGNVSLTDEEELLIIHRLHHVIRPFILRRKKDEVEKFLPGKTQVILKCDMSAWQKVYYKQVTDMGRVGLQTGSGKSKSLQNLTMQLRKCCNHPYLFVGGDYNMWKKPEIVRASGKFELLDRLLPKLRKAGHRILLFSQMTRLIDVLEIYLTLNDYKYLRLDGTTKTDQRGLLLKQFNEPDSPYFMFLLSTRAGGLGLNLQTADTVIIFDSDWNPQMDQQAEDRAHRIGQKKEVRVFVLVSVGSVEEVILERAKQKMGIDAKVIQAGLFNTTSTAQDRREMLEEIMRKGTSSLGTDVPSEREINRLAARSEDEFWMFERMDEERRRKENYRARLMQEQEVPEWAYTTQTQEEKLNNGKFHFGSVTGKRKRKEIVYSDTLSELQWLKAVESGEDLSKLSMRYNRREENASNTKTSTSKKVIESIQTVSDGTSEEDEEEQEEERAKEMSGKQRVDKSEGDRLFVMVRPRKLLFMAIDGVAPRAKMNQQRARRFRAAKDAAEAAAEEEQLREEFEREGKKLPPKVDSQVFDSNVITPGTEFMATLSFALRYYIHVRLNSDPGWKNIKVILSDANVPGEGEHKIMSYIRCNKNHPGYNPNTHHCLYGLDADLIMLSLATHEIHFSILREVVFFPGEEGKCFLCGQEGHRAADCEGKIKRKTGEMLDNTEADVVVKKPYEFVNIWILREYLEHDMQIPGAKKNLDRLIDDFIFICFFVGNDFLPHMPTLEIREGAIELLMSVYKNKFRSAKKYLTDSSKLNLRNVERFIKAVGMYENQIFQKRAQVQQRQSERFRRDKARDKARDNARDNAQASRQFSGKLVQLDSLDEVSDSLHSSPSRKYLRLSLDDNIGVANVETENSLKAEELDNEEDLKFKLKKLLRDKGDGFRSGNGEQDKVKLNKVGWRERYYEEKFAAKSVEEMEQIRRDVVLKYTEGLCWIMHYYYHGVCSWNWFYPYHYAPFASDLKGLEKLDIKFELGSPFKPFNQLLAVLPSASAHALPECYRSLMTNPDSPIADFYPADFEIDMNGKRYSWQGISKLPFVEEKRLLEAAAQVEKSLTNEEIRRNSALFDMLFVVASHPLGELIRSLNSRTNNLSNEERATIIEKIDPGLSDGMNGYIASCGGDSQPSCFCSTVEGMEDVLTNQVICAIYKLPEDIRGSEITHQIPRLAIPKKTISLVDLKSGGLLWHEDGDKRRAPPKVIKIKRYNPEGSISGGRLGKASHRLVLQTINAQPDYMNINSEPALCPNTVFQNERVPKKIPTFKDNGIQWISPPPSQITPKKMNSPQRQKAWKKDETPQSREKSKKLKSSLKVNPLKMKKTKSPQREFTREKKKENITPQRKLTKAQRQVKHIRMMEEAKMIKQRKKEKYLRKKAKYAQGAPPKTA